MRDLYIEAWLSTARWADASTLKCITRCYLALAGRSIAATSSPARHHAAPLHLLRFGMLRVLRALRAVCRWLGWLREGRRRLSLKLWSITNTAKVSQMKCQMGRLLSPEVHVPSVARGNEAC